jgi:hypothetical protein
MLPTFQEPPTAKRRSRLIYQDPSLRLGLPHWRQSHFRDSRNLEINLRASIFEVDKQPRQHRRNGIPTNSHDPVRRWHCQRRDLPSAKGLHLANSPRYRPVRPPLRPTFRGTSETETSEHLLIDVLYRTVHTGMAKNKRQPYAVSEKAGHQTSAESWGTGQYTILRSGRTRDEGSDRSARTRRSRALTEHMAALDWSLYGEGKC